MRRVFSFEEVYLWEKILKGKELGIGLTQRKDGRYSAKYTTNSGKRSEKYFEKLSDARLWLNERLYEKNIC